MAYENIIYETEGNIAIIRFNRPKALNAINLDVVRDVNKALDEVEADPSLRALILTGAGDKAFVAGADISLMVNLTPLQSREFSIALHDMAFRLEGLPIPVIACVNGFALGGGCELAMACTFRVVSENAQFGLPELGLGVIPGYGGTQRLARIIGKSRALWMMLTGEMMGAEEALDTGLANKVVKSDELMEAVFKVAKTICKKGPLAVKYALIAVQHGIETDLETGLIIESAMTNLVLTSKDKEEGVAAFLEKRKPVFQGK